MKLTREDLPKGQGCCIEESSFTTLFPSYLESHLRSLWNEAQNVLRACEIRGELNLIEGSMTVKTTRKTFDPLAILQARDFIRLLARSVPLSQAQNIFRDEMSYDIIKIGNLVHNTQRFVKRRDRLVGPNGQTLRTLEILTECYVFVQGKTVSVMGPEKGIKQVRRIVLDTMRNIHPVYGLKRLMILKELSSREDLAHEDWSRFLPTYRKAHQKKTKHPKSVDDNTDKPDAEGPGAKVRRKREKRKFEERTTFPPLPQPRKEDIAMETGQAFLAPERRKRRKKKRDTEATEEYVDTKTPVPWYNEHTGKMVEDEDIPDDEV